MTRRTCFAVLCAGAIGSVAMAGPSPVKSGPPVGGHTLPFTSNLVSGPHRGQQHCYICDLVDEPAVLVFARTPDEPTGRLLRGLRDAVREHRNQKLFAWAVFLGNSGGTAEAGLEQQVYEFAKTNEALSLPISVLGDPQGPPGYLVSPDAEVTILGFRRTKVVFNRAYRPAEWNRRAAEAALKDLPSLLRPGSGS